MTDYKHCTNCGQRVSERRSPDAANPAVAFCCECGRRLQGGICKNTVCKFYEQAPDCTPAANDTK
jgi:hypothetical protein